MGQSINAFLMTSHTPWVFFKTSLSVGRFLRIFALCRSSYSPSSGLPHQACLCVTARRQGGGNFSISNLVASKGRARTFVVKSFWLWLRHARRFVVKTIRRTGKILHQSLISGRPVYHHKTCYAAASCLLNLTFPAKRHIVPYPVM